jgi:hypothetical protein
MLSHRKILLRTFEVSALLGGLIGLAMSFSVASGSLAAEAAKPFVLVTFTAVFAVGLVTVSVANEFIKVVRAGQPWLRRIAHASFGELKVLVQWCPRALLILALLGAVAALAIALPLGHVRWYGGQPFTGREAIGFAAGAALFYFVSVPVLASASRMPGTFAIYLGKVSNL